MTASYRSLDACGREQRTEIEVLSRVLNGIEPEDAPALYRVNYADGRTVLAETCNRSSFEEACATAKELGIVSTWRRVL
jgi:hypothetical protein